MLKIDTEALDHLESKYPGIREMILRYEDADIPVCPACSSSDTADVQVGLVGYSLNIDVATSKFHLISNGPKLGNYFCNSCRQYFD